MVYSTEDKARFLRKRPLPQNPFECETPCRRHFALARRQNGATVGIQARQVAFAQETGQTQWFFTLASVQPIGARNSEAFPFPFSLTQSFCCPMSCSVCAPGSFPRRAHIQPPRVCDTDCVVAAQTTYQMQATSQCRRFVSEPRINGSRASK